MHCTFKNKIKKHCDILNCLHYDSFPPTLFLSLFQTKLVLQKQLTKNLAASFLPTHMTPPTLCTVAANPLALRHPPGTTFIQTPILGPALFRPAPGPLRATHTPIIFSPYWSPINKIDMLFQQGRIFTWFSLTIRSQYWRSLCKLRPCSRSLHAVYTRIYKHKHTPIVFPILLKDCDSESVTLELCSKGRESVWER